MADQRGGVVGSVVEIEYLHSASHWSWQAAATVIALAILATRARRGAWSAGNRIGTIR